MNTCVFVTGNDNKWLEIKECLSSYTDIQRESLDLVERQGSLDEIARAKACEAYNVLQRPCIVEDVSLELEALGSFPGPYVKHFLAKVPLDDIHELAKALHKKKITAHCTFALASSSSPEECHVFHGKVEGTVVSPRGSNGFGFDAIFEIEHNGSHVTLAEMTPGNKNTVSHRGNALKRLVEFFENRHE